jgi:hypothetical protein
LSKRAETSTDLVCSAEHQRSGKIEPACTPKSVVIRVRYEPVAVWRISHATTTYWLISQLEARRSLVKYSGPDPLNGLFTIVLAVAAWVGRCHKVGILSNDTRELDRLSAILVEAARVLEVDFCAAAFAAVVVVAELSPAGAGESAVGEKADEHERENEFG